MNGEVSEIQVPRCWPETQYCEPVAMGKANLSLPDSTAPYFAASFSDDVDKIVPSGIMEILMLPSDTSDGFFYSSRKRRAVEVMRALWDANLQHIRICHALLTDTNPLVPVLRDLQAEINVSRNWIFLRMSHFCRMPEVIVSVLHVRWGKWSDQNNSSSGVMARASGVILYKEYTASNQWICCRNGLFSSEWTACLKWSSAARQYVLFRVGVRTVPVAEPPLAPREKPLPPPRFLFEMITAAQSQTQQSLEDHCRWVSWEVSWSLQSDLHCGKRQPEEERYYSHPQV